MLHHLSFQYKDSFFFSQFSILGTITVALFFFLSGYGLMKQAMKYDNYYTNFLSKRFSKLLPPFLIATICYICYSVTVNGGIFVWNRFIEVSLHCQLLGLYIQLVGSTCHFIMQVDFQRILIVSIF